MSASGLFHVELSTIRDAITRFDSFHVEHDPGVGCCWFGLDGEECG
jgi:hypothetical protein